VGQPTAAQCLAWPALAAGRNLLLGAPTGSGKTLAAFLPILDQLLAQPPVASVRCLYVAPLKALVNDARRNLEGHLDGIRRLLPDGNGSHLRIGFRTGDTSARARRELRLRPPDILLTTPESLAVLLSQAVSAGLFACLRWIVVDELHALAPTKRGADLALSLERLAALTGTEPQRIGLSATCTPLAEAAGFLVGAGRPCALAQVPETTPLELHVEPLDATGGFLQRLAERLHPELSANRSTLIFTNVRSLAERLGWVLRRRFPDWDGQIAVHHSALAAARRRVVERQLKEGRLRVVISSTSLELGIDIGSVDGVVLVHPPGDVVRLLQRVGRGGHGPGRARRGLVLTASPAELLEAAVTAAAGRSGQCEPLGVPAHPLDVLCQQLVGMAAQRPWLREEAFQLVRRAWPYRDLPRDDFDGCLDYLSGRRADGRPWLPERLCWSGDEFTLTDPAIARVLRRNLGTILAEETRPVVQADVPAPAALVGQVDEPFADRLQPGDRFLLDGRCLEYRRSEGSALVVAEVAGRPAVPVWGGSGLPLSLELARRLYLLRLQAGEALRDSREALLGLLRRDYDLGAGAAAALAAHFELQECVSEIPDPATCLVEFVSADAGGAYYVHTPLNRSGNDALARVAVLRLVRDHGRSITSIVADLGFALLCRSGPELTAADLRGLLAADGFDAHLAAALAESDSLRERFRRVALIGLMVLRQPLGRRRTVGGRDWVERRLFGQVRAGDPDFVLLRQALREVQSECCDAAAARVFLGRLPGQVLRVRRLAQVSPFAAHWTQLAAGPAEMVDGPAEALRRLHAALTGVATGGPPVEAPSTTGGPPVATLGEDHAGPQRLAVDA
jgi:ATP-dependent Lhr-like helicase